MKSNLFYLSSLDSNERGANGIAASTCTSASDENVEYQFLDNAVDHEEELEFQMRTISPERYKMLMNLIPEVEKLRHAIKNLTTEIELKDLQIKELRELHQMEQAKCINVSHLSAVSISFYF